MAAFKSSVRHYHIATLQLPVFVLLLLPVVTSRNVTPSDDVTISGYYVSVDEEFRRHSPRLLSAISTMTLAIGSSKSRDLSTIVPDTSTVFKGSVSTGSDRTALTSLSKNLINSTNVTSATGTTVMDAVASTGSNTTESPVVTSSERDNIASNSTNQVITVQPISAAVVDSTTAASLPEITSSKNPVAMTGAILASPNSPAVDMRNISKPVTTGSNSCTNWKRSNLEMTTWLATEVSFSLLLVVIVLVIGITRCRREWKTRDFKPLSQELDF